MYKSRPWRSRKQLQNQSCSSGSPRASPWPTTRCIRRSTRNAFALSRTWIAVSGRTGPTACTFPTACAIPPRFRWRFFRGCCLRAETRVLLPQDVLPCRHCHARASQAHGRLSGNLSAPRNRTPRHRYSTRDRPGCPAAQRRFQQPFFIRLTSGLERAGAPLVAPSKRRATINDRACA